MGKRKRKGILKFRKPRSKAYKIYKNVFKVKKLICNNCKKDILPKQYYLCMGSYAKCCLSCAKEELQENKKRIKKIISKINKSLKWLKDNPKEVIVQKLS